MQDLFDSTCAVNFEERLMVPSESDFREQNELKTWNQLLDFEYSSNTNDEIFTLMNSKHSDTGSSSSLVESSVQSHFVDRETNCEKNVSNRFRSRDISDNSPHRKPYLPPCKICGATATGFHYGANTCEACKGFFRRTSRKNEVQFRCKCSPEQREAWKRGPCKHGCPACRLQRCVAVGMSRSAIKLGRYSYAHKTSNTKQAKYFEAINSCKNDIHTLSESSSSSSSLPNLYHSEPHMLDDSYVSSTMDHVMHPFDFCESLPLKNNTPKVKVNLEDMGMTIEEVESDVATLTEAHIAAFQPGHLPVELIKRKHTEYLENYNAMLKKNAEPDVTFQKQGVMKVLKMFEEKVIKAVSFAKKIPGFGDLTLEDQASLIKASRVEITLFGSYKYLVTHLDTERKMITTPWGEELHLDELNHFLPINIVLQRHKYAQRLFNLNLSTQELSVLQAVVATAPDRCLLEQPDRVDAIQQKLVTCLQYLLSIRPGGHGSMFYKMFNLITDLRELTEVEAELSKKMLSDWPAISNDNFHLLKELTT